MDGTCDLAIRDCEQKAEYDVTISDPQEDSSFPLERECCESHRYWYRNEYGDRGYEVEVSKK